MDQEFRPRTDRSNDHSLPSVDEIVERLGRLWAPASTLTPRDADFRDTRLGRYQLRELRGQGAFGVVYLARDTQLERDVALKVPRSQVLADPDKRRRFEAEASAAAMLDHPGIVTVYEAELTGPAPYMASAFCAGPDLGEWLAGDHPTIDWRAAAEFVAKLADAVDYAHKRGVFHRDLKPSNVLLAPVDTATGQGGCLGDYEPKITDFGLAKLAQSAIAETRSSMLLGTPLYMAPEQLESNRGAPPAAADIYSLGCLLYELVTGRLPIEGDSYIEVLDRLRESTPAPLSRLQAEAPRGLETICSKCLEKDPLARYANAAELAADLRSCVAGEPIVAREVGLVSRLRYWWTRPQRIRDAGWYTLCVQLLLMIWVTIAFVVGCYLLSIPRGEVISMAVECAILIALVNGPMGVAGWYTIRQRPWAIYAGLGLSAFNVIVPPLFMALSVKPFFAGLYARVDSESYHAFAICSLIFFAEAGQVLLYAAAISAWRVSRRQIVN
jgi:hypothetical protein